MTTRCLVLEIAMVLTSISSNSRNLKLSFFNHLMPQYQGGVDLPVDVQLDLPISALTVEI